MDDNAAAPVASMRPPGPPAPPATAGGSGSGAKRKRKGCLVAVAVVVIAVLVLAIGAAILLGQASKVPDAGVAYTEEDFDRVIEKLGVAWPELPEGANPADYERVYAGEKPLDATLTEAEISALMSFRHDASYWPIKSMQLDLTGGDTARVAGTVTYAGRDWSVSAAGSGSIAGTSLEVEIASASVTGIDVPAEYLPLGARFLEGVVNPRLARIPGLNIETFEVTPEGVHLTGTTWETAEYMKKP